MCARINICAYLRILSVLILSGDKQKQDTFLLDFLSNIQRLILDKIFHDQQYIIGKYNLLKNTGEIKHDQMHHRDYQPRQG